MGDSHGRTRIHCDVQALQGQKPIAHHMLIVPFWGSERDIQTGDHSRTEENRLLARTSFVSLLYQAMANGLARYNQVSSLPLSGMVSGLREE
jgi:hypothetical protein